MAGAHQPDQRRDGGILAQHQPPHLVEIEGEGGEGNLEIGCKQPSAAFDEGLRMADRRGQRALSAQRIAQHLPRAAQPLRIGVERGGRNGVDQMRADMILKIAADAGQISHHRKAHGAQMLRRAHP
jgi:hypothetical protein